MSGILEFLTQYPIVETAISLVAVLLLAFVADQVSKRILLATVKRVVRGTAIQFDDLLLELNVFGRLAHLAPALAIYFGIQLVPGIPENIDEVFQNVAAAAMVLVAVTALAAFLTAVEKTYANSPIGEGRPIEAYVQVTKIAMYVLAAVIGIATLLDQDLTVMLGGLGAFMAVSFTGVQGHDPVIRRQPPDGQLRHGSRRRLDRDESVWRRR